jgi:hypothetical protein
MGQTLSQVMKKSVKTLTTGVDAEKHFIAVK